MFEIKVSAEIVEKCPCFSGIAIYADVINSSFSEQLWIKINEVISVYKQAHTLEDVKTQEVISATRSTYKLLGKDPNRYRPSSEALCRRIIRGLPLYKINTLVDIINLVSIQTGYSIGGFDVEKIEGNELILGIGQANEPYESIGRGLLNIEGLPVYRDNIGGIGTPTSDNERTKLDLNTTKLLVIFNGYHGKHGREEAVNLLLSLLREFAQSKNERVIYF